MRVCYGDYPEYHNSLANLDLISEKALLDSVSVYLKAIEEIEATKLYKACVPCRPMLGKRNYRYPIKFSKNIPNASLTFLVAYCNGKNELQRLPQLTEVSEYKVIEQIQILLTSGFLEQL